MKFIVLRKLFENFKLYKIELPAKKSHNFSNSACFLESQRVELRNFERAYFFVRSEREGNNVMSRFGRRTRDVRQRYQVMILT